MNEIEYKEFGKKIKIIKKQERQLRHNDIVNVVEKLNIDKSELIIDAGCGWGQIIEMLCEKGYNTIGFEPSIDRVEYCKKRGLNVTEAFIEKLPLKDKSVYIYITTEVLEHLEINQFVAAIKEADRVLNNNGYLIATFPAQKESLYDKHHKRIVKTNDIMNELKGYSIIEENITYRDEGYKKHDYNRSNLIVLRKL